MNYGKAVNKVRIAKDLSKSELARLLEIPRQVVSDQELSKQIISEFPLNEFLNKTLTLDPLFEWLASEKSDADPKKQSAFELVKPTMDGLIIGLIDGSFEDELKNNAE